jgi:hypothetical protein
LFDLCGSHSWQDWRKADSAAKLDKRQGLLMAKKLIYATFFSSPDQMAAMTNSSTKPPLIPVNVIIFVGLPLAALLLQPRCAFLT